jgi:AraC-like DNA-binding protein
MRTNHHLDAERDSPWYLELPASPELTPWISHFRVIRSRDGSSAAPAGLRLLTDGCTGLVIDCAPSAQTSPVFIGVMQVAAVVKLEESRDIIGVRFRPGGALPFVAPSLHEFTGRRVPLPLLWGGLAQRMGEVVRAAPVSERVPALEHCLRDWLRRQRSAARGRETVAARESALVSRAIARLRQQPGMRVRDVASALGISERRLERVFNRAVGVPPKVFHRMCRCCEAARLVRQASRQRVPTTRTRNIAPCNWSAIASAAGYADQAHFIREFRALTGVTPVAYAMEHRPVGFMQYDGSRPN